MRAALFLTAALIAAPAAFAQSNTQYQGGDASSTTVIDVGQAQDAAATSVASGNVVTGTSDDTSATILNDQHMDGATSAVTAANVDNANGNIAAASAAVANGSTTELRGSTIEIDSLMRAHGDATAFTTFTGGHAQNASTSASSAGNVSAVSAEYSDVTVHEVQESAGAISAIIEANHGQIDEQVVSGAIASANNSSVTGYTTTLIDRTEQRASGAVNASVTLNADHATDASGDATASANAITIDNQWGYTEAHTSQTASANVSAHSEVTLNDHFNGFGAAGAYGVGNQMVATNVGSDTLLDTVQDNSGNVSADAAFSGQGGDSALASAAAYGNNVEGALCTQCDVNVPSLTADNNQVNSGNVSASARVNSAYTSTVAAGATAIGNAATYAARGP